MEEYQTLLNEKQASEFLNVAPRTLSHWRFAGRGPQYVRISHRCVRYRQEDLQQFIESVIQKKLSSIPVKKKEDGDKNNTILTGRQAAEYLKVNPITLSQWRSSNRGPQFIKISHNCVRYRQEDLQNFVDSLLSQNTSQA